MHKLNHRQLALIFIILGLSFFRLRIIKNIKFYLQKYIYKSTGLFIDVTNPHIKKNKEIDFKYVYIKTKQNKLFLIEDLIIKYDITAFLRTKSIIRSILEVNSKKIIVTVNQNNSKPSNSEKNLTVEENDSFLWEKKYHPIFYNALKRFFRYRINHVKIKDIYINMNIKRYDLYVKNFKLDKDVIVGEGIFTINELLFKIPFNVKRDIQGEKIFIHNNNTNFYIHKQGKEIFKLENYSLSFKMQDKYNFIASGSISQIYQNYKIISTKPIMVDYIDYEVYMHFTRNIFKISNESAFSINNIPLAFSFYHDWKERDLAKISITSLIEGNSFFQDYPFFILNNMCSIKAKGDLIIRVDYMFSMANLKKYHFNAEILENTLDVVDFGDFDISYIASEFEHQVYLENGNPSNIKLSKNNPNYIELKDIPKELKNIIVLTEDPNYHSHFGIDDYNIGNAIAMNISKRKFVKGASTITMQLARNLFLNHTRNVSRKIDEMIIAWLLENHFNISKDRILELYLNIIEFGSNTWGICEASKYYFDKDIRILGLTDYIVLSYIIPRPKYFLEAFLIKSPQLKNNLKKHIQDCSNRLYKKDLISTEDFNNIKYDIKLKEEFGCLQLL